MDLEKILLKVQKECPEFYVWELLYQCYRSKFSEEYFKGSEWYRGDCLYDYILDKKLDTNIYLDMILAACLSK